MDEQVMENGHDGKFEHYEKSEGFREYIVGLVNSTTTESEEESAEPAESTSNADDDHSQM